MENSFKLVLMIISIFFLIYIIYNIYKEKLSIKNSILWIILVFLMMFSITFDGLINSLSSFIGFKETVSFVYFIGILFLGVLSFKQSITLNKEQSKIVKLSQEIALIEKSVRK